MTGFVLKIIAVLTMVLDHIKYAIPATDVFLTQYFGRISFPIFAFLITEGYIHTRSRKKYIKRLLVFAIISQVPFMLFRSLVADKLMLNIIVTFLLGILGIEIFDYFKKNTEINNIFKNMIVIIDFLAIAILGSYISVDYSWFGIVTVWCFYILKSSKLATLLRIYFASNYVLLY